METTGVFIPERNSLSYYAAAWAIVTFILLIQTFKINMSIALLFANLTFFFVLLSAAEQTSSDSFLMKFTGGWGIWTALSAAYAAAAELTNTTYEKVLPMGNFGEVTTALSPGKGESVVKKSEAPMRVGTSRDCYGFPFLKPFLFPGESFERRKERKRKKERERRFAHIDEYFCIWRDKKSILSTFYLISLIFSGRAYLSHPHVYQNKSPTMLARRPHAPVTSTSFSSRRSMTQSAVLPSRRRTQHVSSFGKNRSNSLTKRTATREDRYKFPRQSSASALQRR